MRHCCAFSSSAHVMPLPVTTSMLTINLHAEELFSRAIVCTRKLLYIAYCKMFYSVEQNIFCCLLNGVYNM